MFSDSINTESMQFGCVSKRFMTPPLPSPPRSFLPSAASALRLPLFSRRDKGATTGREEVPHSFSNFLLIRHRLKYKALIAVSLNL